jgi:MerR HTH family regulatory protein
VTIPEAAKIANVNPMTVRRWLKHGLIQGVKTRVGGNIVWHVAEPFAPPVKTIPPVQPKEPPKEEPVRIAAEILEERIQGLQALYDHVTKQCEGMRTDLSTKDEQIRSLLTTNARLAEQNAELQARALPSREDKPTSFWGRLFGGPK